MSSSQAKDFRSTLVECKNTKTTIFWVECIRMFCNSNIKLKKNKYWKNDSL